MGLEEDVMKETTWEKRTSVARKGIREYLDKYTIPLISIEPNILPEYGDVSWALGFLLHLALEESKRLDKLPQ